MQPVVVPTTGRNLGIVYIAPRGSADSLEMRAVLNALLAEHSANTADTLLDGVCATCRHEPLESGTSLKVESFGKERRPHAKNQASPQNEPILGLAVRTYCACCSTCSAKLRLVLCFRATESEAATRATEVSVGSMRCSV